MISLEGAIQEVEDIVSWNYHKSFPNSEFRKDLENNAEYVKSQAQMILKFKKKKDAVLKAIETIENLVIGEKKKDGSRLYDIQEDGNLKVHEYQVEDLIEYCDVIKKRIAESKSSKDQKMTIKDLNDKYVGKYLYFNGDEDGEQIILVNNIHQGKDGLEVDGCFIDLCNTNHQDGEGVLISEVEDYDFGDFWYFDSYEDPEELDKALQESPIDTDLETHVMTTDEVMYEILNIITWAFDDFDPKLFSLFGGIKERLE